MGAKEKFEDVLEELSKKVKNRMSEGGDTPIQNFFKDYGDALIEFGESKKEFEAALKKEEAKENKLDKLNARQWALGFGNPNANRKRSKQRILEHLRCLDVDNHGLYSALRRITPGRLTKVLD